MSQIVTDEQLRIFPKVRQIPEKKSKTFILFPFELHAKMNEPLENKIVESKLLIANHLKIFKKPYVATSHGKDSLVMTHLVIDVCKEEKISLPEFWLNDTLNTYKEEKVYWDYINKWFGIEDKFRRFTPPKLPNGKQATVFSVAEFVDHLPNFRKTSRGIKGSYKFTNIPECCDWLKKKSIKDFLKELPVLDRYDCSFVGTRAEENQNRSLGVLQRCRSYLVKTRTAYPIRVVTPLSFWKSVDVLEYIHRFGIPKNPVYEIHNIKRMGCASCTAYIGWEIDHAKDPTLERFGQLKKNLLFLRDTEPERFQQSIETLQNYLKSKKSLKEINEGNRDRLIKLIKDFTNFKTLSDFDESVAFYE